MFTGVHSVVVAHRTPGSLVDLLTGPLCLNAVETADTFFGAEILRFAIGDSALEIWRPHSGGRFDQVVETRGDGLFALILRSDATLETGLHLINDEDDADRDTAPLPLFAELPGIGETELLDPTDAHGVLLGIISAADEPGPAHPVVASIDHVVIVSNDAAATAARFSELLGSEIRLRMTRPGAKRHLEFMKIGQVSLEFAGPAEPADGPFAARLWGLVLTVHDLPSAVEAIRDSGFEITDPTPAVQPGAMISTVKDGTCGIALALIQYHAR